MSNRQARELGHDIPTAGTLDQLSYCTKCGDPFNTERPCPGKREFSDALQEQAYEFLENTPDPGALLLLRALHALLIQVHNDALDEAQRVIGNEHLNTFIHLKYPRP